MAWPLNESAFYFGTPEELWRASCSVAPQSGDQAEYLHEMAVELLDIRELPTYEPNAPTIRETLLQQPAAFEAVGLVYIDPDADIPF